MINKHLNHLALIAYLIEKCFSDNSDNDNGALWIFTPKYQKTCAVITSSIITVK